VFAALAQQRSRSTSKDGHGKRSSSAQKTVKAAASPTAGTIRSRADPWAGLSLTLCAACGFLALDLPVVPGVPAEGASASIDFEAGRFFERADSRGTLNQEEFQQLWRAARTGEPIQPPSKAPPALPQHLTPQPPDRGLFRPRDDGRAAAVVAPPASELPLPAEFDAGGRFQRFDRCVPPPAHPLPAYGGAFALTAISTSFLLWQSNHDGYISRSEYEALVAEWEREGTCRLRDPQLFDAYDKDRDEHLSRGDFLALVRAESSGQGETPTNCLFP